MDNKITGFALLLVALVLAFGPAYAQTMSTANFAFPMPVSDNGIKEMVVPASTTLTLGAAAKQMVVLPAGTKQVICTARGGIVHYGSSTVKSTADGQWPEIASGSSITFNVSPLESQPKIYFSPQATGTTPIVRFICIR